MSMSVESPSASTPTTASGPASAGIQLNSRSENPPAALTRQAATAATRAAADKTIDRYPAARPWRRRGATTARTRKDTAGSSSAVRARMAGLLIRVVSSLEQVQVIGHHGAAEPEDQDDNGEAERDLRHRDGDGEHGEDHPDHVRVVAREGDQVDVDGIDHELDAEQDANGIPARDDAEEADGEEGGGQREIGAEAHAYSSGLAK